MMRAAFTLDRGYKQQGVELKPIMVLDKLLSYF